MSMTVGFSRRDITPQWGVPLAGYGDTSKRISNNVLDPLTTSCVAFTDEQGQTLLLISNDLVKTAEEMADELRTLLSQTYDIPFSHIMICNTHTHCGPDLLNYDHEAIIRYRPVFVEQVKLAAGEALADRKPAKLFAAKSNPVGLNWARHYVKDPETGKNIAHMYDPDNELRLIKIVRENAKDILLMNWQGHPCFYDGYEKYDISADYIHAVRAGAEEQTGMHFMYFQGAAGDLTVRSKVKALRLQGDTYDYAKLMVPEILKTLENITPVSDGPVKVGSKIITLDVDHSDDCMLDDAKKVIAYFREHYDTAATKEFGKPMGIHSYYHACAIARRANLGPTQEMKVYAASVGGLGLAFAPYEMFSKNGKYVKDHSPFETTFMIGYSNAAYPYIADDFAFEQASYEVDSRSFVRGTGEKLAEGFAQLLQELK